jgi:mannose-6-phosphate isomerase-like protein (cupin superfamily)
MTIFPLNPNCCFMKFRFRITGVFYLIGCVSLLFSTDSTAQVKSGTLQTQIMHQGDAKVLNNNWGQMLLYTDKAESYGTKDGLVALAHVLPGKSAHPEHRHAMEEYLYLVRGEGEWRLDGKKSTAKAGDVLYIDPWKFHGLVNTGKDTLTFFVVRYTAKNIKLPAEPEGSHGQ